MTDKVESIVEALMEDETFMAEYQRHLLYSLVHGRSGFPVLSNLDNVQLSATISADRIAKSKMPQKVCNYRNPKLHWFGEASTNVPYNMRKGATHWAVVQGQMLHYKLEDYYKDESLKSADPFRGKRFIGITEPDKAEQIDNDFLKRVTGDEWVETRTLDVSSKSWVPQGKIFIASGQPLRINRKSEETIEQVERIEYTED